MMHAGLFDLLVGKGASFECPGRARTTQVFDKDDNETHCNSLRGTWRIGRPFELSVKKNIRKTQMTISILRVITAIFGVTFSCGSSAWAAPEEQIDREASALVSELLSQKPPEDLGFDGVLKTRHKTDPWIRLQVKYSVKLLQNGWEGIYETTPTNGVSGERLVVVHQDRSPTQYLHLRARKLDKPLEEPVRLSGDEAAIPFAGTEFWLSDLGLEFLHWPKQRLIKDPKLQSPMKMGRPCKVLESVNPNPGAMNYSRVVAWIDSEYGGVIYAKAFDAAGKEFKVFSLKATLLKKAQVEEMRIFNDRTDSRTFLEFKSPSK